MRRGLEARRNRGPGSAVHSCALHRVRDTRALADEKFKARLAEMGAWAIAGSPADAGKLIDDEIEKWGKVIRSGNIKVQ